MKKSFVLYYDQHECIEDLTNEQKGQLLDMMFLYGKREELPECDPVLKMAFKFFKIVFDRDNVKWEKKASRSKENGKKGGRPKGSINKDLDNNPEEPKKPSGLNDNPGNPEQPVSVNVSSNVSVNANANTRKIPANPPDVSGFSPELMKFVTDFQNHVKTEKGKQAPEVTNKLIKECCSTVDKLIRIDNFTIEEVRQALQWGLKDEFYSGQLFSLASLRVKKGNGNKKFQNLYNQFINSTNNPGNKPDLLDQEFSKIRKETFNNETGNPGSRIEIS